MQELSVKECLSFGWRTFKVRPWFFIGSSAVLFLAGMIAHMPETLTKSDDAKFTMIALIGFLISAALSILISMGRTAFYLKAHDATDAAEISDLWHPHPYWKFVGASILAGAATILGLILLIVPGIIIGIMVCFTLYIVIDTGMSPVDAIKESVRITKGNRWNLLILGLAVLGINILGICLVLVGLLASLPISGLAVIHAYRTLSKKSAAAPAASAA